MKVANDHKSCCFVSWTYPLLSVADQTEEIKEAEADLISVLLKYPSYVNTSI
jgi:hypothetical protein